ncbi:hypothetical protein LTS18_011931 [Coniosporium uncinatum]|uniref:Uncharacterized protein n=1 Tax=Coniosporium uncinatum TaxID=93489 RepID=A0ACC3D9E1_9PEZI|nr:hypothetical protein LTS18_011931 [Coniosporium uncinatum]
MVAPLSRSLFARLPSRLPLRGTIYTTSLSLSHQTSRVLSTPTASSHISPFTTTSPLYTASANMASKMSFMDAIKARRTYYQLNKEVPIDDSRIEEIVKHAVLHVPSSFNSQSSRLVVLLKKEHDQFWDFTLEILKLLTPADKFDGTKQRINGFKAGYGTILFFEDPDPVHQLEKNFPLYADHFPTWSEHTSAMHQYALWVALEAEGCGASLQHYNPVVDQKIQDHWKVPQEWKLRAQLVFGGRAGEPGEKQFKPLEERLFIHGK